MTQGKDTVVKLAALDGVWEVGGVDRKRGIAVELERASADEWGPQEASFNLRRDPRAVWPDLGPFTPVEIEVAGVKVWAGFINDTPSTWGAARAINAKCLGWQFHLDDDQYERVYVHNKLSDWRDLRSYLTTTINRGGMAAGQVTTDRGVITIGWPKGAQVAGGASPMVGVTLDLGPASTAKRIVIDWTKVGAAPSAGFIALLIRGHDIEDGVNPASYENALNADVTTLGASGTTAFTFTTARRYVTIALFYFNAANVTFGEDNLFRITAAKLFADTAYESGNESILTSPTLIVDALDRGTVLLSSDRSQIDPDGLATFALPSFGPGEPQTTREVWAAANGLYDNISQIDVERRPVFKPKPTSPIFEVGEFSPFEFGDGGSSGSEIYNRVIVTGQTPDGAPMRVERTAGANESFLLASTSSPSLSNPSFDVDTSAWTATTSTLTRDTGVFDSSPASGRWDNTGANDDLDPVDTLTTTFAGTFQPGLTYVLQVKMRGPALLPAVATLSFGDLANNDFAQTSKAIDTSFRIYSVVWTPTAKRTGVTLKFVVKNRYIWIDSVQLYRAVPTLVDKRGFRRTKRLPISMPLPADGAFATKIADTWLGGHKLVPFKGETTVVGDQVVRGILTGETVPLERLLLNTQQLLRFNDRIDPDTGGQGRDGRMTKVDVDFVKSEAKLTIDNTRTGFEALLNRLAAVITG